MSEAKLKEELYGSFKNRGMIYYNMYKTLSAELGKEKAAELMMDAIYKRGVEQSKVLQGIDNQDVKALMDKFLAIIPDGGQMFGPEILNAEKDAVDIKFHRCPLKECLARGRHPRRRGGRAVQDRGPGRQRALRGCRLLVPRRDLGAGPRRLLSPASAPWRLIRDARARCIGGPAAT